MKKYFLPWALLLLLGCQTSSTQETNPQYWDLPNYCLEQASLLQKESWTWEKSVRVGKNHETKEFKTVDWEKELALFLEVDLNKTAYAGRVKVTDAEGKSVFQITEPDLPIRKVEIRWAAPAVPAQIDISWLSQNTLYQTNRVLRAVFEEGKLVYYRIQTNQKITGLAAESVLVEGKRKGS